MNLHDEMKRKFVEKYRDRVNGQTTNLEMKQWAEEFLKVEKLTNELVIALFQDWISSGKD